MPTGSQQPGQRAVRRLRIGFESGLAGGESVGNIGRARVVAAEKSISRGGIESHVACSLMRFPIPVFVASITAFALGLALSEHAFAPPVEARASVAASGPVVALLLTRPGAGYTSLLLARAGESAAPTPVARFDHEDGAAVKGAILPGTSVVLAVADTAATRDLSFASSLFRVEPHRPAERLCDGVVHASRPLVTAAGRVFVSRGVAGSEPAAAKNEGREDALTIDEIDPATGGARPVHSFAGYLAFLAGEHGREILIYRVGAGGADLIGVDPDTGTTRVIAPSMLPFARDFSVDPARGAVVFQERDERDSRTWVIDRMDLATGARTRLAASSSMSLAPSVWPGGGVAYAPDSRGGLTLIGREMKPIHAPAGDGVDQVQALSRDGAWVAALHTRPGELPVAFAIEAASGRTLALPNAAGARVAIAGFVAEGGAQ
jgi:hypothetical protein